MGVMSSPYGEPGGGNPPTSGDAHLIDVPALARADHRMRKDAAVGVDGVTKEQYGQDLEANLRTCTTSVTQR